MGNTKNNRLNTYGYDPKKAYQNSIHRLEKANISETNKTLILDFHEHLFAKGVGYVRIIKLTWQAINICLWLNKDLLKLTRKDLIKLVSQINRDNSYAESTKSDYKRLLKQLFHWYKEEDQRLNSQDERVRNDAKAFYRYLEKEIKKAYRIERIDPNLILTWEQVHKVITNSNSIRNKAIISFLWETGVRSGELLNIRLSDLRVTDDYGEVVVDGKTGKRSIIFITSLPYILQWMSVHPEKGSDNAYLWITCWKNRPNQPIIHRSLTKILDTEFERACLKKIKHNPHWFRHSCASRLAQNLTEQMLCQYMGWELGSQMIRTYTHLQPRHLKNQILELNGLQIDKKEIHNKPVRCICGTSNPAGTRYCYRCSKPLSVNVALEDKNKLNSQLDKTIDAFGQFMADPNNRKRFEEFEKNLRKGE